MTYVKNSLRTWHSDGSGGGRLGLDRLLAGKPKPLAW